MRKESLIFYLTYHTRKPNTGATLMTAKLLTKAKRFSFSLLRIPLRQDYGAIESIGVAQGYKVIMIIQKVQKQCILEKSFF